MWEFWLGLSIGSSTLSMAGIVTEQAVDVQIVSVHKLGPCRIHIVFPSQNLVWYSKVLPAS